MGNTSFAGIGFGIASCVLIMIFAATHGCSNREDELLTPGMSIITADSADIAALVKGNTEFAVDLYKELMDEQGNLFFSPHSISTALAMTYAGARGQTAGQIAQVLHFSLQEQLHPAFAHMEAKLNAIQEKGDIQLNVANSLWPHKEYPFLNEYLAMIQAYYGVLITPVDYIADTEAARGMINAWVEEKTRNKIKDMIPPGVLNTLTRLVLVNAIYFKGNWASQFDVESTEDAPFLLASGGSVQVPMMRQEHEFGYAEHEILQVLELPYIGDELSMLVLLPKEVDGLEALQDALSPENLEKWTKDIRKTEVSVFLPKFRLTSQFNLSETLVGMGMPDAFIPGKADLSGMDGRPGWLYISAVLHKAFVDVNEEGTEAAASTAVVVAMKAVPQAPVFRADHPFIFLIRDNHTGSILFMGRITNPAE